MSKATIYVYEGTVMDSEDRMRCLLDHKFSLLVRETELNIGDEESLKALEKMVKLVKLYQNVSSLAKEITV